MAGPKKRRNLQGKSDNDSDNDEVMDMQCVQADFEGRNPDQCDFHGIKQLLKQLFLKSHLNISELVDLLISQQGIGSVLKQSMDDDEDDEEDDSEETVFGITSVINLSANKEMESIKQLFAILKDITEKFAERETQEKMDSIINDGNKRIGLLVNERFLNIPPKIADPLMNSLLTELDRFSKKNDSYKFDYFIMICKTYKTFTKDNKEEGMSFVNQEEEMFSNAADASFEFCVENESDTGVGGFWTEDDKQMVPYRKILLMTASKLPNIIHNVKQFVA